MTTNVNDWYRELDRIAPFNTAEKWDNVGLLVGSGNVTVQRVLFALDVTPAVLDEAKMLRCQLIVSHHPVIFKPISSLPAEHIVYRLASAGIAVISAHTNLDIARGGVNDALADRLGLLNLRPLHVLESEPYRKVVVFAPANYAERIYNAMCESGAGCLGHYRGCAFLGEGEGRFLPEEGANPAVGRVGELERVKEVRLEMLVHPGDLDAVLEKVRRAHPYEEPAYDVLETFSVRNDLAIGRIGDLPEAVPAKELAELVRDKLGAAGVRFVEGRGKVTNVAVCGGSGSEYLSDAKRLGAQALVTGEARHHDLLQARELGLTLIDAGHYATEAVVLEPLMKRMREALPGAELMLSKAGTDGVKFV